VADQTPVLRDDLGITTIGLYDFLLDERSLEL
jgi:hypothetical protein